MIEFSRLIIAILAAILLSIDLYYRWVHRHGALEEVIDWKGIIPLPALAVLGGFSSYACGWIGWGLLITAGMASADAIKIVASPSVNWERAIVIRATLVFQAATIAMCIRSAVQQGMGFL